MFEIHVINKQTGKEAIYTENNYEQALGLFYSYCETSFHVWVIRKSHDKEKKMHEWDNGKFVYNCFLNN